jgi:hypothetical protein
MKTYIKIFVFIPFIFILSCARFPELPQDQRGPGYISANELMKKGENPHGIPQAMYAFYPKDWELKTNSFGQPNAPYWDQSWRSIKVLGEKYKADMERCWVVERLFEVQLGSGKDEIEISPVDPVVDQRRRVAPLVSVYHLNNTAFIRISKLPLKNVAKWFDLKGRAVTEVELPLNEMSYKMKWKISLEEATRQGLSTSLVGKTQIPNGSIVELSSGLITIFDNEGAITCLVYMPSQVGEEADSWVDYRGNDTPETNSYFLMDGSVLKPMLLKNGIGIYRYFPK